MTRLTAEQRRCAGSARAWALRAARVWALTAPVAFTPVALAPVWLASGARAQSDTAAPVPQGAPAAASSEAGPRAAASAGTPVVRIGALPEVENPVLAATEKGAVPSLSEVLEAAKQHPAMRAAAAGVDGAGAARDAAWGAFDPSLKVGGKAKQEKKYENARVDASVQQDLPFWGAALHGGYRVSRGEFPVYDGDLVTSELGEVRAGLDVQLAKGGAIDKTRARLQKRELDAEKARCSQLKTALKVRKAAAAAYWSWVSAAGVLHVERRQLAIAEARASQLKAQIERGARPDIDGLDNDRQILSRRAKVLSASQKFVAAAQKLSVWWRDTDGRARLPGLPAPAMRDDAQGTAPAALPAVDAQEAVRGRPVLCGLDVARRKAQVELRLAENARAPEVKASVLVAQGFAGPEGKGTSKVSGGLTVKMPALLTEARAKVRQAEFKLRAVDAEVLRVTDALVAEVNTARAAHDTARAQVSVAKAQRRAALALAAAERKKLELGASTLITVNLREKAAADAERQVVKAEAALGKAAAAYDAAIAAPW